MFGYSVAVTILPKYKKLRACLPRLAEQRWYQGGALRVRGGELNCYESSILFFTY
jgi:hypothetical protein